MNTINLSLSLDELNLVLDALGNKPYAQVFQLIHNIQEQAQKQLETKEEKQVNGKVKEELV